MRSFPPRNCRCAAVKYSGGLTSDSPAFFFLLSFRLSILYLKLSGKESPFKRKMSNLLLFLGTERAVVPPPKIWISYLFPSFSLPFKKVFFLGKNIPEMEEVFFVGNGGRRLKYSLFGRFLFIPWAVWCLWSVMLHIFFVRKRRRQSTVCGGHKGNTFLSLPRKKMFEIGLDCIFRRSPFEGILLRVERVVFCLEWILQHIRINTGQEKHKLGG